MERPDCRQLSIDHDFGVISPFTFVYYSGHTQGRYHAHITSAYTGFCQGKGFVDNFEVNRIATLGFS